MENFNNGSTELEKLKELTKTGEKQYKIRCECCNNTEIITRRDINFKLVTFLLALKEMSLTTGEAFHNYSDVIQTARRVYKANPTDYAVLLKFRLIETLEGEGNSKYKRLSAAGEKFVMNDLAVALYYYSNKQGVITFCTHTRLKIEELVDNTTENEKYDNEPFYMTVKQPQDSINRMKELIGKKTFDKSFL